MGSSAIREEKQRAEEKKAKAKKRIEQLKASKRQRKAQETGARCVTAASSSHEHQKIWADILWDFYSKATGHAEQVRRSTGLVPSAIHPSSPVSISVLEQALLHKDTNSGGLLKSPDSKARPKVLFVSSSAIGSLDCLKNCQSLHKACPIAKLFAKHMKIEEQAAYLQETSVNLAIGTPNRLLKLATDGHLDVSNVTVIVVDMRKNPKQQNMMSIPDVSGDWWKLWERFFMEHGGGTRDVQLMIVDT